MTWSQSFPLSAKNTGKHSISIASYIWNSK
uniref:Uncharacterized protein n=1 Tax=Arundo donax TaxID=35708 RepID=A0A0A9GQM6_ARUDO